MKKLLTLSSILFTLISCSKDTDELGINSKPVFTTIFENKVPGYLIGNYGTKNSQQFTERGTVTLTNDSVIINTVTQKHSFKITEHFNWYSKNCRWVIVVDGMEYHFNASAPANSVWFKIMKHGEANTTDIGTYFRDINEEPETPQQF